MSLMPENPYLPDKGQQLAMMLMALGGGISQSAANGTGVLGGIGPGVAGYANALGQAQQRQEADALRRWQIGLQERELKSKEDERNATRQAAMTWTPPGAASVPGMSPPPTRPRMGPDSYEPTPAGAELRDYLIQKHGFTPVMAATAVGNFAQESNFNPTAVHDGGTGYGLGGWRLDRRDALQNYAKLRGGNVADPKMQADFFVDELKTRPEWSRFSQAQDPQTASTALMDYFRPAGWTPNTPTAGHGYENRVQYAQAYGGPNIAQGSGDGSPVAMPPPSPPSIPRPSLSPDDAARIQNAVRSRQITPQQGEAEANRIITEQWNRQQQQANQVWQQQNENYRFNRGEAAKAEQWYTLGPDDVKMFPGLDPSKAYQRNKRTGEVKPIGAPMVNIDQKGEGEFAKTVGKNDAERLKQIQDNASTVLDTVAKIRSATDLLSQTYTGPGAEYANAWYRTLGSLGVESAKDKADAATAAQALIAELTPRMRVPGSGATSDFEMQTFGKSLVSLMNTPGGNEKITRYWERIAERQVAIQGLAEKYATENKGLTGTKFAEDVKALGPIFSKEEIAEMKTLGDAKKPTAERPPLSTFGGGGAPQNMTPMPTRPPLDSFGGRR